MYKLIPLLLLCACEEVRDMPDSVARKIAPKAGAVVEQKIATHDPTYKIGQIAGPHSGKLRKHIQNLVSEDKNGYEVDINYSIKHSSLMVSDHTNSMFDNLTIKIRLKYRNQEEHSMLQYHYCSIEKWEYDEAMYYLIAQRVIMMMTIIDARIDDAA